MIDLRSDTLTKPHRGHAGGNGGRDGGGRRVRRGPDGQRARARVARLLGHEAGLFCVTGSLANLLGVRLLVEPGQEVLCDVQAHIARAEMGAHAAVHGLTMRTFPSSPRPAGPGRGGGDHLAERRTVPGVHRGGRGGEHSQLRRRHRPAAASSCRPSAELCREQGSATTSTAPGCGTPTLRPGSSCSTYGRLFDTVSVCFSKGLGAPVGSVLVSSAENIARARVLRKRLGGGWRQAGMLAAAAGYALDHQSTGWPMIMPGPGRSRRRWRSGPRRQSTGGGGDQHRDARHRAHPAAEMARGRGAGVIIGAGTAT